MKRSEIRLRLDRHVAIFIAPRNDIRKNGIIRKSCAKGAHTKQSISYFTRARIKYSMNGMNNRQYSFQELSKKTVVNVADGKELGHVCDMIFNACGNVTGLVVPGKKSILKSITSTDSIFIPYNRIIKIGQDAILVEMVGAMVCSFDGNSDDTEQTQRQYNQNPYNQNQSPYNQPQNN